jgi:hypothetical protein
MSSNPIITTATGEIVSRTLGPDGELEWTLVEDSTYFVQGAAELVSARFGELELRRVDERTMRLPIGRWVSGSKLLHIAYDGERSSGRVRVIPRREKLDERAWLRMITDLETWLPGVSVGATGGTSGELDRSGTLDAPLAAIALLPMVPALTRALRTITSAPRERELQIEEHVPLRAVRRADANSLQWLCRHPDAALAVDAWRSLEEQAVEPRIPQGRAHFDHAHPVNRYVAWALHRAIGVLDGLANRLTEIAARPRSNDDDRDWATARARAARVAALDLAQLHRRSFLHEIAPAPPSPSALLSLRDSPAYARFHAIVRPFTSPRFRWQPERAEAGARPTYELYELWSFLAVTRQLEARLPGWKSRWRHEKSRDFAGGIGPRTWFELKGEPGVLRLHFNLTFPSYRQPETGRFSLSTERRPDIVVSFSPAEGGGRWMFLDAKYRVSKQALGEAFESIHIYRDALRWPELGGRATAGYLLVPAHDPDADPWFTADFQRRHSCGGLELRPGHEKGEVHERITAALSLETSRPAPRP